MKTWNFLAIQASLFLSVKLSFMGLPHYNNVDWSWSLAYGSLFILPLVLFRKEMASIIPISIASLIWVFGRYIEIGDDPNNILLFPHLLAMLAVVCVLCDRGYMVLVAMATSLYSVWLISVGDVSFWQQGIFNVLFASLTIAPIFKVSYESETPQKSDQIELERAA